MVHPVPPRLPHDSLVTLDRQYLYNHFQEGLTFTLNAALAKDNHYTLFRYEDWPAWVTFTAVFIVLIVFDHWVLNRGPQSLTVGRAILYTLFWMCCAFGFCGWVYWYYGQNQAFMWISGYMLEWMLSFDNLFVFHLIFSVYATPDHLKHRPLYLGICGAILFRLAFIFVGEYLMHAMFFMHFLFGSFLIYTGVKTVACDDDEQDPSQHPLVQWLQHKVPFVSAYDEQGHFFVRVPVDERGEAILPDTTRAARRRPPRGAAAEADALANREAGIAHEARYGTVDFSGPQGGKRGSAAQPEASNKNNRGQLRATMLFLVVICLEISDLLFAVDSVSAIVAQVNDLFLAYTSAVFAMLGLRATFFIIDVLAKVFSLLKYGVSAVLVFIGVKLICARLYHIPPGVVCVVLVTCIAASMVASVVQEEVKKRLAERFGLDLGEKAFKAPTPKPSPVIRSRTVPAGMGM